jgi:menaquinone-dependent protoporphyrinogen IX oxidase
MKILVAYYSRTGVTRKAAQKIAETMRKVPGTQVEIEEIVDRKSRGGVVGWLGAGKDASLKRPSEIEPVKADVADFDAVVVGTPVWAGTVSSPVRTFCSEHGKSARNVAFFCTMGGAGESGAFAAMKDLCGREPLVTLALLERSVKRDDEEKFVLKVNSFVGQITGTAMQT